VQNCSPLLRRAPSFGEPEAWGSGTCPWHARTRHTQNPVRRPLSRLRLNDRDRARVPQRPPLAGTAVVNLLVTPTNQATSLPFVKSRNSAPQRFPARMAAAAPSHPPQPRRNQSLLVAITAQCAAQFVKYRVFAVPPFVATWLGRRALDGWRFYRSPQRHVPGVTNARQKQHQHSGSKDIHAFL
jgi:hypothetical protein